MHWPKLRGENLVYQIHTYLKCTNTLYFPSTSIITFVLYKVWQDGCLSCEILYSIPESVHQMRGVLSLEFEVPTAKDSISSRSASFSSHSVSWMKSWSTPRRFSSYSLTGENCPSALRHGRIPLGVTGGLHNGCIKKNAELITLLKNIQKTNVPLLKDTLSRLIRKA